MLRTLQEIFGLRPFLGEASDAIDLGDLFLQLEILNAARRPEGGVVLTVQCVPGTTNTGQFSDDLSTWNSFYTNISAEKFFQVVDTSATNANQRFYRFLQLE